MKKIVFQVTFEVKDDTNIEDLKTGMYQAMSDQFAFDDDETCVIAQMIEQPRKG